jgi:hypothetical protein
MLQAFALIAFGMDVAKMKWASSELTVLRIIRLLVPPRLPAFASSVSGTGLL